MHERTPKRTNAAAFPWSFATAAALLLAPLSLAAGSAVPAEAVAPAPSPTPPSASSVEPKPDAGAKAAAKKVVFKGTVQNDQKEPVAGATVTVVRTNLPEPGEAGRDPMSGGGRMRGGVVRLFGRGPSGREKDSAFFSGRTDAAGAFVVEAEGDGAFHLRVDAPGFAPSYVDAPKAGENGAAIVLARGFKASGMVADLTRSSVIADAEVAAVREDDLGFVDPADPKRFAATARTGRDGAFLLPNLAPGFYTFRVSATGRARFESAEKGVGDSSAKPFTFYLQPGFDVMGKVLDPAGKAIENVEVVAALARQGGAVIRMVASGGFSLPSARTDKEGRFTLKGVPSSGPTFLQVRTKEYAPFSAPILPPRSGSVAAPVEIRLEKGVRLRGRLVDAEQKPVSAKFEATLTYRDPKTRRVTLTVDRSEETIRSGADGVFTIERLPVGTARVRLEPEGYKEIDRKDVVIGMEAKAEAGGNDLGTIVLERGTKLAGKVVDSDGKPVKDAKVVVSGGGQNRAYRRVETKSNAEGAFEAAGLDQGTWRVEATAAGYARASKDDVEAPAGDVELRLSRAGSIKGRVVSGEPAAPVSNFSVSREMKSDDAASRFRFAGGALGDSSEKKSDPGGRFTVDGLLPGTYTITMRADGLQDLVRDGVEVSAGDAFDLGDLVLSAGGSIRGRVVAQPEGLPVAGAGVRVKSTGLFDFRRESRDEVTLTDLAGRFELRGLPVGQKTIVVEPENYAKTEASALAVEEGQAAEEIVVNVGKGGRIEGRVLGPDGLPQSGITISAMSGVFDFSTRLTSVTDDQGRYAIENVGAGTVRVTRLPIPTGTEEDADAPAGRQRFGGLDSISTDVKEGATAVVNFGEKKIKITGLVKRKEGATAGMQVLFVPSSGGGGVRMSVATATVDDAGRYEVSVNDPGDYMVRVGASDGPSGTMMKVTVPDKPDFSYDIVFPEGAVSGRVMDAKDGSALKAVTVIAQPEAGKDDSPRSLRSRAGNIATTAEDGTYRLEGLTPGPWNVSFVKDGYATELRPVVIKGTDEVSGIDQALGPGSPFKLRVEGPNGAPVQGALVFASQNGQPVAGVGGMTREDGVSETKQLKAGMYTFRALTRDHAPGFVKDVSIGGEEDSDTAVIRLSEGGTARIVVRDGGKQPISGASVSIECPAEPDLDSAIQAVIMFSGGQAITSTDGSLRIQHLPAGKYEATIEKGSTKTTKDFTIEEGATADVAVTLE